MKIIKIEELVAYQTECKCKKVYCFYDSARMHEKACIIKFHPSKEGLTHGKQ